MTTGQRVVIGLFEIIGRDNGDLIVFTHVRQPCLNNPRWRGAFYRGICAHDRDNKFN